MTTRGGNGNDGNDLSLGVVTGFFLLPFEDKVVLIASWFLFYVFARFFFSRWLFRDYEIKSWTTQVSCECCLIATRFFFESGGFIN